MRVIILSKQKGGGSQGRRRQEVETILKKNARVKDERWPENKRETKIARTGGRDEDPKKTRKVSQKDGESGLSKEKNSSAQSRKP